MARVSNNTQFDKLKFVEINIKIIISGEKLWARMTSPMKFPITCIIN